MVEEIHPQFSTFRGTKKERDWKIWYHRLQTSVQTQFPHVWTACGYLLDAAEEDGVWLAGGELRCEDERSRTSCIGCASAVSSATGKLRLGTCTGRTTTRSHAATQHADHANVHDAYSDHAVPRLKIIFTLFKSSQYFIVYSKVVKGRVRALTVYKKLLSQTLVVVLWLHASRYGL
jgi:hypothetical protein